MGTSWLKTESGTKLDLNSICFTDEYSGFIVGDSGLFMVSTNGGNFWEKRYFPSNSNLIHILMMQDYGIAISENNRLFRTSDNGETWQQILIGHHQPINNIASLGKRYSWICGNRGMIWFSDNLFSDWQEQYSTTSQDLHDIDFFNDSTGYAVGMYGTTLRFKADRELLKRTSKHYPGGNINFALNKQGIVKIEIIKKNEKYPVKVLNTEFPAGKHSVYLPGRIYNLKQGVYFARIKEQDGKISIKKFMVF